MLSTPDTKSVLQAGSSSHQLTHPVEEGATKRSYRHIGNEKLSKALEAVRRPAERTNTCKYVIDYLPDGEGSAAELEGIE
jgi:hypothetical protein